MYRICQCTDVPMYEWITTKYIFLFEYDEREIIKQERPRTISNVALCGDDVTSSVSGNWITAKVIKK